MKQFLMEKTKYIREPWRLRVHLAYLLLIIFSLTADPQGNFFWIGSGLIIIGLLIRAWASGIIKKDDELATDGPYSLCRNPLYVGNFMIGYGFSFINGHPASFIAITVYFLIIYPFTLRKEETKLEKFFGDDFIAYRSQVRRFIPRLTPYTKLGGWSLHQYLVDNKDFLNETAVLLLWFWTIWQFLPA